MVLLHSTQYYVQLYSILYSMLMLHSAQYYVSTVYSHSMLMLHSAQYYVQYTHIVCWCCTPHSTVLCTLYSICTRIVCCCCTPHSIMYVQYISKVWWCCTPHSTVLCSVYSYSMLMLHSAIMWGPLLFISWIRYVLHIVAVRILVSWLQQQHSGCACNSTVHLQAAHYKKAY